MIFTAPVEGPVFKFSIGTCIVVLAVLNLIMSWMAKKAIGKKLG